MQEKWQSIYSSFNNLRSEKPGAFCTIISLGLIVLAIFGHIVSGQWIVVSGLMVAGLVSTKHQFKFVQEKSGWYFISFLIFLLFGFFIYLLNVDHLFVLDNFFIQIRIVEFYILVLMITFYCFHIEAFGLFIYSQYLCFFIVYLIT